MAGDGGAKAREAGARARTARANGRAADLAPIVAELRAAGVTSLRGIAAALNERGFRTARGIRRLDRIAGPPVARTALRHGRLAPTSEHRYAWSVSSCRPALSLPTGSVSSSANTSMHIRSGSSSPPLALQVRCVRALPRDYTSIEFDKDHRLLVKEGLDQVQRGL
jgi:hypothetical protein